MKFLIFRKKKEIQILSRIDSSLYVSVDKIWVVWFLNSAEIGEKVWILYTERKIQ